MRPSPFTADLRVRRLGLCAVFTLILAPSFDAAATAGDATATAGSQPATLRVDYLHSGNATAEHFALERVVVEPLPWPGDLTKTRDETNLGKYRFEVIDQATRHILYSRGFASIYGEWETTGEAAELERGFGESLRFPMPAAPVQLVIEKRNAANEFRRVWSVEIDPSDPLIDRSPPPSAGGLIALQHAGEPASKVDLLILGDGYSAAERGKCEADGRRLMEMLFAIEPFTTTREKFNVWGLCPAAAESGISRPSLGIHRRSPVGTTYDAFGSERYVLTFDNRGFRDIAAQAPYEFVEIMTNSKTYGGGGIFGQFATVAADSAWAAYLFVHEFGHHFAGLADEYYTSPVAYMAPAVKIEPWEKNATALLDPATLKWRDLMASDTPLPTPWRKAEFEERSRAIQAERQQIRSEKRPESDMDALFERQRSEEELRLGSEPHAHAVGAFEGANYEATGYFRPQVDCVMFSRNRVPFCAVCRRALEEVIALYAR